MLRQKPESKWLCFWADNSIHLAACHVLERVPISTVFPFEELVSLKRCLVMECWDLHNSGSRGRFNNITRRGLRFTETCPFFRKVSQRYPTGPPQARARGALLPSGQGGHRSSGPSKPPAQWSSPGPRPAPSSVSGQCH